MTPRPPLPGGPYLVVGLARSGVAAARLLHERGEDVVGVDAGHPAAGLGDGITVHLGVDGLEQLAGAGAVVKSPGVPRQAPVVAAARERGIPVLGELELAWRLLSNPFVAVTGTNGKTTTVELIGHVLRESGLPVAVAGNVGTAVSSLVGALDPEATVVCEASSFQLEDTLEFAPEVAVLLNLAPDHADRQTPAEYRAAKLRAFANQGPGDVAVIPPAFASEDLGGSARRVAIGGGPEAGLAGAIRLPGAHNRANAMAAAAACLARGVEPGAIRAAFASFGGVEHRLEEVARHDGVLYVNDSKATNVDSTLVALAAYDAPIHLILGGQGKGQDFTALRTAVAEHCRSVQLIGADAAAIRAAIGTGSDRGDLERAVAAARAAARPGDVVLLSPACASFDQYADFEARGRHFKQLVH